MIFDFETLICGIFYDLKCSSFSPDEDYKILEILKISSRGKRKNYETLLATLLCKTRIPEQKNSIAMVPGTILEYLTEKF